MARMLHWDVGRLYETSYTPPTALSPLTKYPSTNYFSTFLKYTLISTLYKLQFGLMVLGPSSKRNRHLDVMSNLILVCLQVNWWEVGCKGTCLHVSPSRCFIRVHRLDNKCVCLKRPSGCGQFLWNCILLTTMTGKNQSKILFKAPQ